MFQRICKLLKAEKKVSNQAKLEVAVEALEHFDQVRKDMDEKEKVFNAERAKGARLTKHRLSL